MKKEKPQEDSGSGEVEGNKFLCKQCNEIFKSAQSFGGHISRKHPKSSK